VVARDRVSDSERVLYSGGVITVASGSGRRLYFGRVIYLFFLRPPNFRRPWADYRETLPDDAVCAEIVYLL